MNAEPEVTEDGTDEGVVLELQCDRCGREFVWRLGEEFPTCPVCEPEGGT